MHIVVYCLFIGYGPKSRHSKSRNPKSRQGQNPDRVKIPTGQNPDMYEILKNWPAQQFSLVAPDNLPSLSFNAARN